MWSCFRPSKTDLKDQRHEATTLLPHAVLVVCNHSQSNVIDGLAVVKSEGLSGELHDHATLLSQLASQNCVFRAALTAFIEKVQFLREQGETQQHSFVMEAAAPLPAAWPRGLGSFMRISTMTSCKGLLEVMEEVPPCAVVLEHLTAKNVNEQRLLVQNSNTRLSSYFCSSTSSKTQPQSLSNSKPLNDARWSSHQQDVLQGLGKQQEQQQQEQQQLEQQQQQQQQQQQEQQQLEQQKQQQQQQEQQEQQQLEQQKQQQQQQQQQQLEQQKRQQQQEQELEQQQQEVQKQQQQEQNRGFLRSWVLVNEATTLATMFTQEGTVLLQSRSSIACFGDLGQRGVWTVKEVCDDGLELCAAYALGHLQGPLLEFFAEDTTEALNEFLEHVDKRLAWRCIIRVKSTAAAGTFSMLSPSSPQALQVPASATAADSGKKQTSMQTPSSAPGTHESRRACILPPTSLEALNDTTSKGVESPLADGFLLQSERSKSFTAASLAGVKPSNRLQSQLQLSKKHLHSSGRLLNMGDISYAQELERLPTSTRLLQPQQRQLDSRRSLPAPLGQTQDKSDESLACLVQPQQGRRRSMPIMSSQQMLVLLDAEQQQQQRQRWQQQEHQWEKQSQDEQQQQQQPPKTQGEQLLLCEQPQVEQLHFVPFTGMHQYNCQGQQCSDAKGNSNSTNCNVDGRGTRIVSKETCHADQGHSASCQGHLNKCRPAIANLGRSSNFGVQRAANLHEMFDAIVSQSFTGFAGLRGGAFKVQREILPRMKEAAFSGYLAEGSNTGSQNDSDPHTSVLGSSLAASKARQDDKEKAEVVACYHELELKPVTDPVTSQPAFLLLQRDVTPQMEQELLYCALTEAQLAMLSQIFPRHVIECLSSDGAITVGNISNMACNHPGVTILFLDIVGFTSMSSKCDSAEVLVFLNLLFMRFDKLVRKYHVQKLDTIGDCFVVGSGILRPDQDGFWAKDEEHDPAAGAGRVLALAMEMQHAVLDVLMPDGNPVQARIGIHTGYCVSGLVGLSPPRWSVWGDTVNVAARMEQSGAAGTIQLSKSTKSLLPTDLKLDLIPSGGVPIKGKGVMETWLWKQVAMFEQGCPDGAAVLPQACMLLHQRFCSFGSVSNPAPLLPKVLQASMKLASETTAEEDSIEQTSSYFGMFNRKRHSKDAADRSSRAQGMLSSFQHFSPSHAERNTATTQRASFSTLPVLSTPGSQNVPAAIQQENMLLLETELHTWARESSLPHVENFFAA